MIYIVQAKILTESALKDLIAIHYSIDRLVTLNMCSGMDVLVPVDLAECRMTSIDIRCVVEHGVSIKPRSVLPLCGPASHHASCAAETERGKVATCPSQSRSFQMSLLVVGCTDKNTKARPFFQEFQFCPGDAACS